jgi:hypothetical protein
LEGRAPSRLLLLRDGHDGACPSKAGYFGEFS